MDVIDDNSHKVEKGDTLFKIAQDNDLSVEELLAINPHLSEDSPLKIGDDVSLLRNGYSYVVKPGDTMSSIAREHGIRVEAMLSENPDVPENAEISIDQVLRIPVEYSVYTVKPKDTLSKISREQAGGGVTVHTLQTNNDLPENGALSVGQKLRIPTGHYMHRMRPGETLYSLEKKYKVPLSEIDEANPGLDHSDISVDQKIRIPSPSVRLAPSIYEQPKASIKSEFKAKAEAKPAPAASKAAAPAAKASAGLTKNFNTKAGELQSYNVLPSATRKAWAETLKGVTHAPVSADPNKRPLIVVDLGHGSKSGEGHHDHGAVSKDGTLTESEIVSAVGRSLAKQLDDKGYQVAFTRNPGEVYLYEGSKGARLTKRAMYAVNLERELKSPYTVFVSLHVNSAAGDAGKGYEVRIPRDKEGKNFNQNSEKLGGYVAEGMGKHHESVFRGVKEQSLGMFRTFSKHDYGSDAAILVELDFINNKPGQERLETMKEKPYNIASGIRQGIEQYVEDQSPTMELASAPSFDHSG